MQFFTTAFLVALFAGMGMAQIPGLPACAQSCLSQGQTTCAASDVACLCGDRNLQNSLIGCVTSSCSASDQAAAASAEQAACGGGGA